MSGHSKWAQIRRQKGVADARRGQMFTKVGREITIATRDGGSGDPNANPRLRLAIQKAREINMPHDNIQRAIQRGLGGGEGVQLQEIMYEAYGPGGVALMIEAATDNRNRTTAEVRNVLSKGGGNLGESGCVSWLFQARGVIGVDAGKRDLEEIALAAIDWGAEDFKVEDNYLEIYTTPQDLLKVRQAMEKDKIPIASADVLMVPNATIPLDEEQGLKVLRLLDKLEELDDVIKVHSNADITTTLLEKYEG